MILLENNRKALYQWDLNQRLILTDIEAGTEVQISDSNNTDEYCLTTKAYNENGNVYAKIPNIYLQKSGILYVYIYVYQEDKSYTKYYTEIIVLPRKKPADYVYTETEIKTFESLEKRINRIEESQDPDAIKNAVNDYLKQNPIEETDPTVPEWAKQPEKPSYTASEVGADATGTAESKVSDHNTRTDTHNDIRILIESLTARLNALADSDDTTLDQMSEVVAYIKSNKSLIDAITTSKINVSDIIDNLTTNVSNKPLSSAQGVALKALIDAIPTVELDETLTDNTKAAPAGMVGELKSERVTKPQWAEFPRATNPARDIYNSVSMANAKVLGTDGTLRHNMMIERNLITWTESTSNVDYADSSGATSVKLMGFYDYLGDGANAETPRINYSDVFDVFPSGSDIYGVDGTVIDTVVASSDSTIVDLGSNNYIIMAGCQGASSYHMIYREVNYAVSASGTITLGDTINVLTINGAEWDMTTLREDYFNEYSQLNTKVIKNSNVYYMAIVQSGIGIAIMKSSDGLDWSLHYHIADTDCHIEACIGMVSYTSNSVPTVYVVVRHKYGDGYITLYGYQNINFSNLISKTFIPASTGRPMLYTANNKNIFIAYSVNGRHNAVIARILPNNDGTSGISIVATPKDVMSDYPCIGATISMGYDSNVPYLFFGGTNGLGTNKEGVSIAPIWVNDNYEKYDELNKVLKNTMFGKSVEVVQTLTEGTEIGSVAGTVLYAPKASASSVGGTPTLELLGSATVSEDTGRVDFAFDNALNLKKILVYAHTIGVSDFSSQARGSVYINGKLVADGFENTAFNSGAKRYMLFEIDILQDCTFGKAYSQTVMGDGWSSEKVAFLMKTDINANTDIVKISFLANQFVGVAIASGTTVSVYGY